MDGGDGGASLAAAGALIVYTTRYAEGVAGLCGDDRAVAAAAL